MLTTFRPQRVKAPKHTQGERERESRESNQARSASFAIPPIAHPPSNASNLCDRGHQISITVIKVISPTDRSVEIAPCAVCVGPISTEGISVSKGPRVSVAIGRLVTNALQRTEKAI